jgi:hypothetical protein
MCISCPATNVSRMDTSLRVLLELNPAGSPVHGQLSTGGEQAQPFEGYVSLIAALEDIRSRHMGDRQHPPAGTRL